jgi:hypothetical protein
MGPNKTAKIYLDFFDLYYCGGFFYYSRGSFSAWSGDSNSDSIINRCQLQDVSKNALESKMGYLGRKWFGKRYKGKLQ